MKNGTTIRIPCGRATELVKLCRRASGALQVQRSTGTRIWINDTQLLAIEQGGKS